MDIKDKEKLFLLKTWEDHYNSISSCIDQSRTY